MMRWNDFSRSVLFGAAAAAAFAPFALTAGHMFSVQWALVGFAGLIVPIYLVGLADTRSRGMRAAALAGALVAVIAVFATTPREALVAIALALGLARSGVAIPGSFARSVVLESLLVAGGLSLAAALIGSSTLSIVLAIWGFFLVQSVFFLVARPKRLRVRDLVDPFDEARDRANAILDDALESR